MIVALPPSKLRARELLAREVAAMLGAGLLYPFGFAFGEPRPRPRKLEQRTIVLVHGYLANRTTMLPLHAYLKLKRLGPVLSFDYASSEGIERSARALKQFCRERVFKLVCEKKPNVARYQERATTFGREIPLVVIEPREVIRLSSRA